MVLNFFDIFFLGAICIEYGTSINYQQEQISKEERREKAKGATVRLHDQE